MSSSARPVFLVLISQSWGEVDWILPVLARLRALAPQILIRVAFAEHAVYQEKTAHPFLARELISLAERVVYPAAVTGAGPHLSPPKSAGRIRQVVSRAKHALYNEFSAPPAAPEPDTAFVFQGLDPRDVCAIFKDYNADDAFRRAVQRRCPQAKQVVYPHSAIPYLGLTAPPPWYDQYAEKYGFEHDLFLLSTATDRAHWLPLTRHKDRIAVVGRPRYDEEWVQHVLADPALPQSAEFRRTRAYSTVYGFFIRHAHPENMHMALFPYLVQSMAHIVAEDPAAFLLVKPHPRQRVEEVADLLDPLLPERWMPCALQPMQMASLSSVVVAIYSSTILDAARVGVPVIEFFQYAGAYPDYAICPNGRIGGYFRYWNLVLPADTESELRQVLGALREPGERARMGREQHARFTEHFQWDNHAAQRAAEAILQCIGT